MPLYEYRCPTCGTVTERLSSVGRRNRMYECGTCEARGFRSSAVRIPSRVVQLNPPTGAGLRSQFRLYQEATQEIGHAYAQAEAVEERSIDSPDLWGIAKTRAQAMVAAGEAPSIANPLKE